MKDRLEEAALVLAAHWPLTKAALAEALEHRHIGAAAEALDRAGQLRTGLEKRAIEACEEADAANREEIMHSSTPTYQRVNRAYEVVREVGRASLAAKKPETKWKARMRLPGYAPETWAVVEDPELVGSTPVAASLTEPQARAIADALNALEEK